MEAREPVPADAGALGRVLRTKSLHIGGIDVEAAASGWLDVRQIGRGR